MTVNPTAGGVVRATECKHPPCGPECKHPPCLVDQCKHPGWTCAPAPDEPDD